MQTEDKRACGACGAANRTDALSCWQCFARFDAPLPPAPGPGVGSAPGQPMGAPERLRPGFPPPAPAMQSPVSSAGSSGTGMSIVVRIVVGLLAAFVGFVGVQRVLGGGGVEIPETVAGLPRMHDAMASQFEEEMKTEAARYSMDAEAGAFGSGQVPDFLLIVVNGSTWETTDQLFDSLVQGMSEGGATVDTQRLTGELGGATYRCVGASAVETGFGVCMWRADGHIGIVLDLESDTSTAETLTQTVYRDVAA